MPEKSGLPSAVLGTAPGALCGFAPGACAAITATTIKTNAATAMAAAHTRLRRFSIAIRVCVSDIASRLSLRERTIFVRRREDAPSIGEGDLAARGVVRSVARAEAFD